MNQFLTIDKSKVRRYWNTSILGCKANSMGTGPPLFEEKALYFSAQGKPFQTIRESDLRRYGLDGFSYEAVVQAEGNYLRFPTCLKWKVNQAATRLRDLLEDFSGAPARPNSNQSGNSPIGRSNEVDWNRGVTLRKCDSDIQVFRETEFGPPVKNETVLTYRELFNQHGGETYILPPFIPDFRVAEDRLKQIRIFRDEKLPLIESLIQASHSVNMEFRNQNTLSAQVSVSSRGEVYLVLYNPATQQERSSVKQTSKWNAINTLKSYVGAVLDKQEEIREQAETKA